MMSIFSCSTTILFTLTEQTVDQIRRKTNKKSDQDVYYLLKVFKPPVEGYKLMGLFSIISICR